MELKEAMKVVTTAIKNDPELFYGYQANIAVCFQDECASNKIGSKQTIHEISNEAAKNFLNLWCK